MCQSIQNTLFHITYTSLFHITKDIKGGKTPLLCETEKLKEKKTKSFIYVYSHLPLPIWIERNLIIKRTKISYYISLSMCGHGIHTTLEGDGSLFPPLGSQGLNSGHHVWQKSPLLLSHLFGPKHLRAFEKYWGIMEMGWGGVCLQRRGKG